MYSTLCMLIFERGKIWLRLYAISRSTFPICIYHVWQKLCAVSVNCLLNAQDRVHWLLSRFVQECIGCCILPVLLRK